MEIHKIVCTKCKKEKDMLQKEGRYYYKRPDDWKYTEFGKRVGDLCPDCNKKYMEYQDKFLEKKE